MTDVIKKIIDVNEIKNNTTITGVLKTGRYNQIQTGINESVPVSGVNGQEDNGYLDSRFDDDVFYE